MTQSEVIAVSPIRDNHAGHRDEAEDGEAPRRLRANPLAGSLAPLHDEHADAERDEERSCERGHGHGVTLRRRPGRAASISASLMMISL
jgi:hypothetical protein